ncbi:YqcI/YcgG family protein [Streptomyces sp. NPDC055808]
MDETTAARLWTSVDQVPSRTPRWAAEEQRRVHDKLLDTESPYPCHFGSIGESKGSNYYTYWDQSADFPSEAAAVAHDLESFIGFQRALPDTRLSLLIMVGPAQGEAELAMYRAQFWHILSTLHTSDRVPQPADAPEDPEDSQWEFTFAGEPLFAFGTCPAYGPRRSRQLGKGLVIAMQCRSVFQSISGSTAAGRAAKKRIRHSLSTYEDVPLLADSGDGTGSTTQKWKQYFPEVDGRPLSGKCPIVWEKN